MLPVETDQRRCRIDWKLTRNPSEAVLKRNLRDIFLAQYGRVDDLLIIVTLPRHRQWFNRSLTELRPVIVVMSCTRQTFGSVS